MTFFSYVGNADVGHSNAYIFLMAIPRLTIDIGVRSYKGGVKNVNSLNSVKKGITVFFNKHIKVTDWRNCLQ